MLLPIGGHKGAGLALIIGLLAGVLNGAAFGRDVVDAMGPGIEPTNTGQFVHRARRRRASCAGGVRRRDGPPSQRAALVAELAGLRRDPDAGRGPRASAAPSAAPNGVQLPPTLIKQLDELAADLKITPLAGRA